MSRVSTPVTALFFKPSSPAVIMLFQELQDANRRFLKPTSSHQDNLKITVLNCIADLTKFGPRVEIAEVQLAVRESFFEQEDELDEVKHASDNRVVAARIEEETALIWNALAQRVGQT